MYQMWPVTNPEIIFGQYFLFVLTYADYQTFIFHLERKVGRGNLSLFSLPLPPWTNLNNSWSVLDIKVGHQRLSEQI